MGRSGLGQSLAQLTFLVQNPTGVLGEVVAGGMGAQELGRFPDQNWCLSPKARPQRGVCGGGGEAERVPSLLTSSAWVEPSCRKSRATGLGAGAAHSPCWARPPRQPQCLAHSKVSHCFLSCSTEPGVGAGAGLTSCLVFHSKSSKGSLAS